MKTYSINLGGRIKNFPLPKNRPLIPLYEAVVNSLHAIEEKRKENPLFTSGKITIEIIRSEQQALFDGSELPHVIGFIITDNGVGFNERNMLSFLESDSTYKADIGGKGVGRFSWLKTFRTAAISSVYRENGNLLKRDFVFSLNNPYVNDTLVDCEDDQECYTRVTLDTYLKEYSQDVPKQIDTIAMRVIQHCLVYFLGTDCPQIVIKDNLNSIMLNQLFKDKFKIEDNTINFAINDSVFNLLNVKIEDSAFRGNRLYLCANNRLVDSKDLENNIVDLDRQIFERHGFWYVGILTSNYLDDHVDMNRLSFSIPDSGTSMFDNISIEKIIKESCVRIQDYLDEYLKPIAEEKTRRVSEYATEIAPQFRHLLKYMPDEIASIKPRLNDDKLDDELYKIKRKFDKNAKNERKELLDKIDEINMSTDEYEEYFQKQIEKISDANSAVLADYVAHRRVIIDLFERGLRRQDDGKFNKEKYMHSLIYPMKSTADDLGYEAHNLWLIDETLSYCSYISSDIPFDNDPKQERTDIMILDHPVAVSENKNDGKEFDTIVLFELKRPMRDDYTDSNNPITQLYDYVHKIRNGEAKDKYHRPIRAGNTTKFYLYAICDITSKLDRFLYQQDFKPTPDKLGYYKFNDSYNAYFEILSYDKILNDAKKRNRVLFEKLGL